MLDDVEILQQGICPDGQFPVFQPGNVYVVIGTDEILVVLSLCQKGDFFLNRTFNLIEHFFLSVVDVLSVFGTHP